MSKEKLYNFIELIIKMEFIDLVRLCLRMSESNYINLKCNRKLCYRFFDELLKVLDNNYVTLFVNFNNYPNVTIAMSCLMEMNSYEQNYIFVYIGKYILNCLKVF